MSIPTNAADALRTKHARIERLRKRLDGPRADLVAVLKGILDLLADEL